MIETETPPERAYLVALDVPGSQFDAEDSLEELGALVAAAGGTVAGQAIQQRRTPDRNSWVGKGKAEEIAREVARLRADIVVADDELSPAQQRTHGSHDDRHAGLVVGAQQRRAGGSDDVFAQLLF